MISYSRIMIVLFFICLFIFDCFFLKIKKNTKWVIIINAIFISLFWGLRNYDIGTDTIQYIFRYENKTIGFDVVFETITILLNYIFSGNITLYLISISLIINIFLGFAIYNFIGGKKSVYVYLITSMFPYIILSNINILRQGMALSLFFYGLSLLIKNTTKKAIIYFVLSALCHKMFIFPSVLFILINRFHISLYKCFIATLIIFIIVQSGFIEAILLNFTQFYFINKIFSREGSLNLDYLIKIIFYTIIIVSNLIFSRKFSYRDNKIKILEQAFLSFLISANLFGISPIYSSRFLVCNDSLIVTLTYLNIKNSKIVRDDKRILILILITFSIIYCFFSTYLNALSTDLKI